MSQSIYNPVTKELETFAGNQEAIAARLDNLADVVAPSPNDGDLLTYDGANQVYKPMARPTYTAADVGTYTSAQIDNMFSEHESNITWKAAVATYADILTTYPNPQPGWTVVANDTNTAYRYTNTEGWVAISANAVPEASTTVNGLMTTTMVTKLNGITDGAQPNQNAFSSITVGNTTVSADNATDTLTLIAGSKITLTPDATNDSITIAADEEPYQVMSSTEMATGTSTVARSMTASNLKTGLKSLLLDLVYPVGSFYISSKNVSPATFLGGTWAARSGYMLRAATSSVTFNTNDKTGGNDSVSYTPAGTNSGGSVANTTLTVNQIPSHNHGGATGGMSGNNPHTHMTGINQHTGFTPYNTAMQTDAGATAQVFFSQTISNTSSANIAHTHSITAQGGGGAHNHGFTNPTFTGTAATINTIPAYRNVYMWERTA